MIGKCENCELEIQEESRPCAGCVAYEITNCATAITNFGGLPSCNCCESCRYKCLQSYQEEYPDNDLTENPYEKP
jgi:hypothetical protein